MIMDGPVLVLAPHTDDGEFGCGGTIAKLVEENCEIYYVAFSTCRASVPAGEPEDILEKELHAAMQSFGIPEAHVFILDYPVREFSEHRQSILDAMIRIGNQVKPKVVFAPSIHDIHQDHHVIAEEAMRAFKKTTLLAYEVPWNNFTFDNQAYFKLEQQHIDSKLAAISCYRTQTRRQYAKPEFTIGQARVHGVQISCEYAEVFEVVRWVI